MSIGRQDCIASLRSAGLSELEATQTVDDMLQRKARLSADGKLARGEAALADATRAEFDAARIEAAARRRQEAITIMRRAELEDYIASSKASGQTFMGALQAKMVGNPRRFFGARQSIDANRSSIFDTFINQLESGVDTIAERNGINKRALFEIMAKDPQFRAGFVEERMSPGSTQDAMIRDVVDLYDRISEEQRLRLNRAGANIAKLEGRLPQSHDQLKLLDRSLGGEQGWIEFVDGALDKERTFPGRTDAEIREILRDVYVTITNNQDKAIGVQETPTIRTPRNVASSLGRHRVLHFKDAQSYLSYMDRYGRRNLWEAIIGEMEGNSRKLSLMETLGPNPEHMLRMLLDNERVAVRRAVDARELSPEKGNKQIRAIDAAYGRGGAPTGKVANWMSVLSGETLSPVDVGVAKAFGIARSFQSMGKLGAATLSAVADVFTKAMNMRVNGANFLERHTRPFIDIVRSYDNVERRILNDLGFYFELENGTLIHRFDQADTMPGAVSNLMNKFFKYSGLTPWTERQKAGMAQWLSNQLGAARALGYDSLDPNLRAMLDYHGIDAARWDVYRRHMTEEYGGKTYMNPSLARNLTDAQISGLLPESLQGHVRKGYTPELWAQARRNEFDRIRTRLETEARAFFADETKFAVIEPDARVTSTMTQGTRPGTATGEALRMIMQFKSFPIAFWQRTIQGQRWKKGSATGIDYPGFVEYTVSALAYGYLAMTLKDYAKNRTHRDPLKPETWLAAAMQSGGAGIYGDFLLGKMNRFGNGALETAAGPMLGDISSIIMAANSMVHGEFEQGRDRLIRTGMSNLPYINMFYVKPAADYFILDSIREWMSPGYKGRMRREMEREFGQRPLF